MTSTIIVPRFDHIEIVGRGVLRSNSPVTAFSLNYQYCVVAGNVCRFYDKTNLTEVGAVRLADSHCNSVWRNETTLIYRCREVLYSVILANPTTHFCYGPVLALDCVEGTVISPDGKRWMWERDNMLKALTAYHRQIKQEAIDDSPIKYVGVPWSKHYTHDNMHQLMSSRQHTSKHDYVVMAYGRMGGSVVTHDGKRLEDDVHYTISDDGALRTYNRDTRKYVERDDDRYLGMLLVEVEGNPHTDTLPVREDGVIEVLDTFGDVIESVVIDNIHHIDWSLFNMVPMAHRQTEAPSSQVQ